MTGAAMVWVELHNGSVECGLWDNEAVAKALEATKKKFKHCGGNFSRPELNPKGLQIGTRLYLHFLFFYCRQTSLQNLVLI